jgi:ankyrin repeat protein
MLLRDFNADPTITTLLGASSPLHLAVSGGYRQIAAILLTYGADVNATDKNGVTPLQLVNNISVLKLLLKHNANILQKNKQGLTALDYYLRYTNPDKGELSDVGLELKAKEIEVKEALKALKSELLQLKNSTWSS